MATYGYSAGYQGGGPSSVPSGYIEAYAQAGQGVYGDVFQQVLGRPSQAFAGSQGFLGQAQGFNPGQLFNPESAYAQNLFAGNQQTQMAANAAGASATSGLIGAGLGALGSIGGGFAQGYGRSFGGG